MEIFYNLERPNYEEIVSYGPKWWTEYREMDANYRFAGWTLDLMAYFLEQTVKNQFPSEADEKTISMLEKLLRIEYDSELTLEERRRIVSAYYSGTGHLSRSVILSLMKAYAGHDGDVYWKGPVLCISFGNDETHFVSIGLLQKILERRMPAHIPFRTQCTCTARLGLRVSQEPWKVRFTQAGTEPMTNTGLGIGSSGIEITPEIHCVMEEFPLSGNSGRTGTFPEVSTGLSIGDGEISLQPDTSAYGVEYEPAGENVKTGMLPDISTGMREAENSVLPEVNTESWSVEYQLCGDTFEI